MGRRPIFQGMGPLALVLDSWTLFRQGSDEDMEITSKTAHEITHSTIVYKYPCGVVDMIHSSLGFREPGWEERTREAAARPNPRVAGKVAEGEDLVRSMNRARSKLRRLALANDFRWFVTLTLDPSKIDREDGKAVAKALSTWADNMVRRKGLKYVLVPELHKKGGIHFHGFFNDAVAFVDSGHVDDAGHPIYNLPDWKLGFTTAIELYDDYASAVGYVCKYIGKQGVRPMGRWYYSGGALQEPIKEYHDFRDLEGCGKVVEYSIPGGKISIVHTKMEDIYGNLETEGYENNGQTGLC